MLRDVVALPFFFAGIFALRARFGSAGLFFAGVFLDVLGLLVGVRTIVFSVRAIIVGVRAIVLGDLRRSALQPQSQRLSHSEESVNALLSESESESEYEYELSELAELLPQRQPPADLDILRFLLADISASLAPAEFAIIGDTIDSGGNSLTRETARLLSR